MAMNKDQQAEAKQLLSAAKAEIEVLHGRIRDLEPKARAFDTMERFAQLSQLNMGSYGTVNHSFHIGRFLEELDSPASDKLDRL